MQTLIFVYNADSGLFNTLADIGHKLVSPASYRCDLCKLTHGVFKERDRWRTFVASLPLPCRFLHRDEFRHEFPQVDAALPAVLLSTPDRIKLGLDAERLGRCEDLDHLEGLIRDVIKDVQ